ncbi:hypothetical protein DFH08DRAFT_926009 [Mycena albidolilacea]|uniref:Uncharacterized protein n=1 Tax=Mycena albidolilacea TaxID=1033008 RepID=A0AAD7EKP6_9AGAR|nr:hypothetical protein DFH08DRAFT_926009 [Mycena albidolilacea]
MGDCDDQPMLPFEEPEPEPPAREDTPPPPTETSTGRGARVKRPTWKLLQQLPPPPPEFSERTASELESDDSDSEFPAAPLASPYRWESVKTLKNSFGLFRDYPCLPTHDPDQTLSLADQSNIPAPALPSAVSTEHSHLSPLSGPPEAIAQSSLLPSFEVTRLIDFLKSDKFNKDDLKDFDLKAETDKFDRFLAGSGIGATLGEASGVKDGWKEVSVDIEVPDGKKRGPSDPIPTFSVPGLHFRNLTQTIKSALQDRSSRFFHYTPFKHYWQPTPDEPAQRIYDEIYSSDAFIEAHEKVQRQPAELGCTLERVVCALMAWSDSTHLANFGTASLWPLYLFFGNQSKWVRGKPRAGACHHIAYMPKLPDDFFDWFTGETGHAPSAEVLTHCRRELMHAVWRLLLDNEFLEACKHGIVIECPDGISQRFYFRFFTYSADYPEKVLLATIRNLGKCPCPRCLVEKDRLDQVGNIRDDNVRVESARADNKQFRSYVERARSWIYRQAKAIKSVKVEGLLYAKSWVPTKNAFSSVASYSFGLFTMLVVDFMHEFELGVWKAIFTHLIRILVAHGGDAVQSLNDRYRQVPTFGQATIRRFTNNASAMKKMAARNFEDLLQCALPVFEGLLDEPHDSIVQDLLFTLAYWQALAKLRLHTTFSIAALKNVTCQLGRQLRNFTKKTCSAFTTKELPREEAARGRRNAKKAAAAREAGLPPPKAASGGSKIKVFNMLTYKGHSLGDYVRTILFFGTTDSYSTQPGELEHRRVKRYYARTNKNDAVGQITKLERREAALLKLSRQQKDAAHIPPIAAIPEDAAASTEPQKRKRKPGTVRKPAKKTLPTLDFAESESLPYTPPEFHHHISQSRNHHFNLTFWLSKNQGDPAIKEFRPKLQEHLLGRLLHPTWSGNGQEFSTSERNRLLIVNDRVYRHKVLRINYTSYDVHRGQDSMNPRTHADIMMLPPNDTDAVSDHPFYYARILGVFHCDVVYNDNGTQTPAVPVSFLWVRRFRIDRSFKAGFKRKRLHRLEFMPDDEPDAYGFVDPDEVIRASHLIPAFAHGPTEPVPYTSLGRKGDEFDDWQYHYVNFFVDRDMFMRYFGGGVGHYQVKVPQPEADEPELSDDEDPEPSEGPVPEAPKSDPESEDDLDDLSALEDNIPDDSDEEEDDEDESDGEEGEGAGELELGPEDGEDGGDDLAAQLRYDEL